MSLTAGTNNTLSRPSECPDYGDHRTSANAVRIQIWVAITVYALVAIIKKRLQLELPLYSFL
jgi:hypothetical protein